MRKLIFTLICSILTTFGFSQEPTLLLKWSEGGIEDHGVITVDGEPGELIEAHVSVQNMGDTEVEVKVFRTVIHAVENSVNYFCWGGNCFPPTADTSTSTAVIGAGEINTEFVGDYEPGQNAGLSAIAYTFYDINDMANQATVVVYFSATHITNEIALETLTGDPLPQGSIYEVSGDPEDALIEAHLAVTNNGSTVKNIKVRRIENKLMPETVNYFCWGACFPPTTNESTVAIPIDPGATNDTDFVGDYEPNNTVGLTSIGYIFYEETSPGIYNFVIIHYNTDQTGTADLSLKDLVSSAYPNPASDVVYFDIEPRMEKVTAEVYNLLGEKIETVEPAVNASKVGISTSNYDDGIYFLSIVQGEERITRKFVVRH